ncbi:MAG: DUF5606 domain-containing protein [Flavisolibacter sp.]|jgi:hypothetical protein|nr:DUF5606 domain-containing protein [Flavisolibacter sp.]
MEYNRIVAVTGMPGLFEVVSSKTDGALVRSLEDQTTKFVSSRVHNMSHLESIEVYTVKDNVQLSEVLSSMKSNGAALPDLKDNKAVKTYFETVFPDIDFERVYASDMKKMIRWYSILDAQGIDFTVQSEEESNEASGEDAAEVAETSTEEKAPAAKAKKPKVATKGAAEKKAEKAAAPDSETEEKPKKTRKKKGEA